MSVKVLAASHLVGVEGVSLQLEDHAGALVLSRRDEEGRPLGALRLGADELVGLLDACELAVHALRRRAAS